MFRVAPPTREVEDSTWRVTQGDGNVVTFASITELSRAILAGELTPNDVLARGARSPRRLSSVLELTSFFARARKQPTGHDDHVETLPGLSDPAQRAAVERARAEIERIQREEAAARSAAVPAPPIEQAPTEYAEGPTTIDETVSSALEDEPPTTLEEPTLASVALPTSTVESSAGAEAEVESTALNSESPLESTALDSESPLESTVLDSAPPSALEASPSSHRVLMAPLRESVTDHVQATSDVPEGAPTSQHMQNARVHSAYVHSPRIVEPRADEGIDPARQRRLRILVGATVCAAALLLVIALVKRPQTNATAASGTPVASTPAVEPFASAPAMEPSTPVVEPAASASELAPVAEPSSAPAPNAPSAGAPDAGANPRLDGYAALRRGDLSRATAAFERAVAKNPYDSEAMSGLGDVARVRGQTARAREIYAQVLVVNPTYLPALLGLGDLAWSGGDRAAARKHYEYIASHYPESAYPARVKERLQSNQPSENPTAESP